MRRGAAPRSGGCARARGASVDRAGARRPSRRLAPGWRAPALCVLLAGCTLVGVPRPASEPPPAPSPAGETRAPTATSDRGAAEAPTAGGAGTRGATPPGEPRRADPQPSAAAPRFGEVRALWVVRTTLTSPERVRVMVDRAHRAGFNTLLVQVRGRGDAYYRGTTEPRAEALADAPPDFDPLDLLLREAHARGLSVHAWFNTHLVWSGERLPAAPSHIVWARPEALAVPRELAERLHAVAPEDPRYRMALLRHATENRQRVEGVFTSPTHAAVVEHNALVIREIVERYPLDGIHLDYVRYASSEYDYSAQTLAAFRAWAGPSVSSERARELDRSAVADPLAWTRALAAPWEEYRRRAVTAGVARISEEVRAARPGTVVSAAVFADPDDAFRHRFQDWTRWAREGLVDVVVPMAYTPDDRRFLGQVEEAVARVGAGRVWAGVGAWQDTPGGTRSKIALARAAGARGFSIFSYDWVAEQRWGGAPLLERLLEGG